jgi:hypothetical protein
MHGAAPGTILWAPCPSSDRRPASLLDDDAGEFDTGGDAELAEGLAQTAAVPDRRAILTAGSGPIRDQEAWLVVTDENPPVGRVPEGRLVSPDRGRRPPEMFGGYAFDLDGTVHIGGIPLPGPDPYCPTPDGGLPDCAAMLAAIEACTGARAEAIAGKPSRHMAAAVLDRLGSGAPAAMVGDRLATDMAMARNAGMVSVLVLTGATRPADLAGCDPAHRPDYIIQDLSELLPARHDAAPATRAREP